MCDLRDNFEFDAVERECSNRKFRYIFMYCIDIYIYREYIVWIEVTIESVAAHAHRDMKSCVDN